PFDHALDELVIPPVPEFLTRNHGEVWSYRQQLPDRIARCVPFAELPVCCGESEGRAPEAGHVDLEGYVQRAPVVALAVRYEKQGEPVPSRMIRIEPRGLLLNRLIDEQRRAEEEQANTESLRAIQRAFREAMLVLPREEYDWFEIRSASAQAASTEPPPEVAAEAAGEEDGVATGIPGPSEAPSQRKFFEYPGPLH